jgi:hypothetical protein
LGGQRDGRLDWDVRVVGETDVERKRNKASVARMYVPVRDVNFSTPSVNHPSLMFPCELNLDVVFRVIFRCHVRVLSQV